MLGLAVCYKIGIMRTNRIKRLGLIILCVLLSALSLSAGTAGAVLVTQHPVPLLARNLVGWSGGLVATGVSREPPTFFATAILPVPFTLGKAYSGANSASAAGLGPNGYPWIAGASSRGATVFEVTPTNLTEVFVFSGSAFSLASAPDGSLWLTAGRTIDRYSPSNGVTAFMLPPRVFAVGIVAGPDNAMWFTDQDGGIGRISPSGEVTMHPVEDGDTQFGWGYMGPYGIARGPDGALWFTEQNHERIGRMTINGELQEFVIPRPKWTTASSDYPQPRFITSGPENSMWFSDPGDSSIGRITMAGEVTEYPVLVNNEGTTPNEITLGPENVLWFSEEGIKDIGSLDPNASAVATPSRSPRPSRAAKLTVTARRLRCHVRRKVRHCAVRHRSHRRTVK